MRHPSFLLLASQWGRCAPHSLFGLAQKENAPRPVEEKKALGALRCSSPPRDGGRREMVPACSRWLSDGRSEEHTSELQSRFELVCRLLLEKKNQRPESRAD